jgi:hypothetical protein
VAAIRRRGPYLPLRGRAAEMEPLGGHAEAECMPVD